MRPSIVRRKITIRLLLLGLVAGFCNPSVFAETSTKDCVILLHGLARTSKSMEPLAEALRTEHYYVINVDYPSRQFPIAQLAHQAIPPALDKCRQHGLSSIHFITHSLGGIVLRQYLSNNTIPELKRVVMFAPPNKGSQVVDKLKKVPGFMLMNGPAGQELGTDQHSIPNQLGPVNFDVGIIAGTRSINWMLSLYLPNPDDGKVSVENTKIDGMRDFIALPVSHPFIMKNKATIRQSLHYLRQGQFIHDERVPTENSPITSTINNVPLH
ncbi:MAG TPA: alpha/beta hydrolase [Cellvibrio sp.]|nr:alpha/beta hydrolase [Cellvibrio sp.]